MARLCFFLLVVALVATPSAALARMSDSEGCELNPAGGFLGGGYGVMVNGQCVRASDAGTALTDGAAIPTRAIDCTKTPPGGAGVCAPGATVCIVNGQITNAFQIEQLIDGKWVPTSMWCPGEADPILRTGALRDAALRLIPSINIGVTRGLNLVQTQTILWAVTDKDKNLGTVTVVGQNVHLRIHFDKATWEFGDGSSATADSPGAAYPSAGECDKPQCGKYFGHVYKTTGTMTVSLTVTWTADFSLNGTEWQPIATDPLPGPASTTTIELKEARGVLVPNPSDR